MMTTWVLLVAVHVGVMGSGNSNAITNVPGFKSAEACHAAARAAETLMSGTVKEVRTACLEVK